MQRLAFLVLVAFAVAGVPARADEANDAKLLKGYLKEVRSGDLEIRSNAAFELGNFPSPEGVTALIKALNDREPSVRANAATARYTARNPSRHWNHHDW